LKLDENNKRKASNEIQVDVKAGRGACWLLCLHWHSGWRLRNHSSGT